MPAQLETDYILRQSLNGARLVAAQTAHDLKQRGYNASQAANVMAADGLDVDVVDAAVSAIYQTRTAAIEPPTPHRTEMIVPVKYREVAPRVEEMLLNCGPRVFMNKLARSERPIMPVNEKEFQSFLRLATLAMDDEHSMNCLHTDLTPHFEEVMYQSVLASRSTKNRLAVAASDGNRAIVASQRGGETKVCLETGECSCERFRGGNFAEFGLACEHIVTAADTVSPHERLIRDIKLA